MSKAHIGNIMGLQGEYILPVNFEDKLFPFYWNTWSRNIQPTIDVSTIVPDAKWGYVLAVEDGTTNLIPYPMDFRQTGAEMGWDARDNVDVWYDQPDPFGGNGAVKFKAKSSYAGNDVFFGVRKDLGGPGTYTFSGWIKATESITIPLIIGTGSISGAYIRYDVSLEANKWKFVTFTGTTTVPATHTFHVGAWDTFSNKTAEIYLFQPQVEQKAWATAFVNGTRDVGRVQYPKEIFPAGDFTLNMWIAHTGDTRTANNSMKIFALDQNITKSRLTLWNYCPISSDTANRRIIADFGNDSGGTRQYKDLIHTTLFVPNQWEMLTVTLNYATRTFSFYRNGILWATHTPSVLNGINAIELYNSGWKYSNLLICPRVVSPEEIRIWYDYGKPFYDPYNYTAIYG